VIRTGVGADPRIGIDLDRLLLASERGGAAMAPADLQAPAAAAPAASDVTFDRVSGSLRVEGSQRPYWLVLGQSWSTGWTASAGGHDLGPPVVVNGYGNAWYVDPAVVGTGPVEVSISWTPQRLVWVFIVVSVLAGLACLVLMLRPGKRSDPPPLADDGRPWHPTLRLPSRFDRLLQRPAVLAATGGGTADEAPAGDDTAVVPGRRRAVLAAVAFGLFAALNLPLAGATPLLAVPLGGAVYLVARWRRGGSLPAALAALALGSTGVYIVVRQAVARYEPVFEWPTYFPRAHLLGLLAVFLLGVEAVRDLLTRRRPTTTASPET
jgi:hypothetical protein